MKIMLLFDAILCHQFLHVGILLRHAGGDNLFASFNLRGDFLVEGEELGEQIFLGAEAVGGEDGGVERGVGARLVKVFTHGNAVSARRARPRYPGWRAARPAARFPARE